MPWYSCGPSPLGPHLIFDLCDCAWDCTGKAVHPPSLSLLYVYCSYYDDFVTIDWVRDRSRDRIRHKRLERKKELNWQGWVTMMWDALSGWLIVFLVGVSSGLLAGEREGREEKSSGGEGEGTPCLGEEEGGGKGWDG